MQVSSRTIRSDLADIIADGNTIHTLGFDNDIGRGKSHKTRIVDLYLSGYANAAIMRKTHHGAHLIKCYVGSFGRILSLISHDITDLLASGSAKSILSCTRSTRMAISGQRFMLSYLIS